MAFVVLPIGLFELCGAQISQCRMHPGPVVYDLDVLEQIQRRLVARGIDPCVHALRLTRPMSDSMAALSHGEDLEPIEGRMPCTRMVLESSGDTYCEPNPAESGPPGPRRDALRGAIPCNWTH